MAAAPPATRPRGAPPPRARAAPARRHVAQWSLSSPPPLPSPFSRLLGKRVQPAFRLPPAPPPGALGLARRGGSGARPAPDARVALVEQGVVWHRVLADVAPHVVPAPVRQRKDFHDRPTADLVVLDQLRGPTGGGLVLTYGAAPGVERDDGALAPRDFPEEAAAVGVSLVQGTRIRERRELHQIEPVALGEAPLEFVGLAEVEPGIQKNYGHRAVDPAEQVSQDHATPTEADREGDLAGKRRHGPGERRRGIRPGQRGGALPHLEGAKHPTRSRGSPARPGDR